MACLGMSLLQFDGSDDRFCIQGQVADAYADRGVDGVRDRGGRRPLRGLAGTEGGLIALDEVYVDAGCGGEPQDRVALPVVAGDPAPVEAHSFDRGPARRLDGAPGQLVAGAVGIDHQPEVGGDGEPTYSDVALGLHLRDDRAPRAPVLVASEPDPATHRVRERVAP